MFQRCMGGGGSRGPSKRRGLVEPVGSIIQNSTSLFQQQQDIEPDTPTQKFVIEVVGALGLSAVAEDINTYCVISVKDKEIHRTRTIESDTSPIWTLKTNSICFVNLPMNDPTAAVKVELCRQGMSIAGITSSSIINFEKTVIGSTLLDYHMLETGESTRQEFAIAPSKYPSVRLALRFRKASELDWKTYKLLTGPGDVGLLVDNAGDTDFKHVSAKVILGKNQSTVLVNGVKETAFRVWPFPDPQNPDETTFLTKEQIRKIALEPSKAWVETGGSAADSYGSIFLEILGCDDLPNMDTELVSGLTDAFVACVYEDSFVRTAVIHDTLCPRWMPWTHRAFEFRIQHPSSILMLGVFDYDEGPLERHDPIGRVVIVPTLFEKDTVYTLKYPLHHEKESRGTLTLRLRIKWHNPAEASKAQSFVRPPRFIINVRTEKAWRTLRYLTRGSVDMTDVTIDTVKRYASEVLEHWQRYCYLLDVGAGILLWRGRIHVLGKSIWFPIHSVMLLFSAMLAVERPQLLPSIVFYLISYGLLWNNYYLSSHPSPWSRVRSFARVALTNHFSTSRRVEILPETGVQEEQLLERLDQYKGLRVMDFLYSGMYVGLKVYRVYSKNTPVDISTESKRLAIFSKLYVNYLYYAHVLLQMMCKYIRLLRNFVNWRAGSTYKFTIDLLLCATIWALFPFKSTIIRMSLRGLVLLIFGPQNKIVDILWIRKFYRATEELLRDGIPETVEDMKKDIAERPSILDLLVTSNWVREMGKSGRVVVENNVKLQAMRAARFGTYSERVPAVDSSRFASIPNSSSFAQPYHNTESGRGNGRDRGKEEDSEKSVARKNSYHDLPAEKKIWSKVPGQRLDGTIIPQSMHDVMNSSTNHLPVGNGNGEGSGSASMAAAQKYHEE